MNTRGSLGNGTRSLHAQLPYNGIKDVLGSVYKEGGVRGLYRGVGIYCLPCDCLGFGIFYCVLSTAMISIQVKNLFLIYDATLTIRRLPYYAN